MYVYYFIHEGKVRRPMCAGPLPSSLSKVWDQPSACAWLIPPQVLEQSITPWEYW